MMPHTDGEQSLQLTSLLFGYQKPAQVVGWQLSDELPAGYAARFIKASIAAFGRLCE